MRKLYLALRSVALDPVNIKVLAFFRLGSVVLCQLIDHISHIATRH